jgi:hypothetical protein
MSKLNVTCMEGIAHVMLEYFCVVCLCSSLCKNVLMYTVVRYLLQVVCVFIVNVLLICRLPVDMPLDLSVCC